MPQDRFFFMHIPKTAGKYMWHLISNNFRSSDVVFWSDKNEQSKPISVREHLSRGAFCGHNYYEFSKAFPKDKPLFIFTMLREPPERLYSQYRHLARARPDLNISLREFVLGQKMICRPDNIQSRMLGSKIKVEQRGDQVNSFAGQYLKRSIELEDINDVLDTAIGRLKSLHCFGLAERIVDSGKVLSGATGMNIRANSTYRGKHSDALSSSDINLINSVNGADHDLYSEAVRIFNEKSSDI